MRLLRFLFRASGRGVVVVALAGLFSGLASSLFVAMVNMALHGHNRGLLLAGFASVAVIRVATNVFSQWFLARFVQQAILDLSDQLSRRVLDTSFRTLERVGPARILSTLVDDVATLAAALQSIPAVITNAAILLGCVIYLAWLSWTSALLLMVFGLLGGVGYKILTRRAARPLAEARAARDTLFGHFRTLTDGIKELKMNRTRRDAFVERDVIRTIERLKQINMSALRHYLMADAWAQFMFFVIMGGMLLGLPALSNIPLESLTGYAFVALYAMTPIWGFIGALPMFHRGETALDRIEQLELAMNASPAETGTVMQAVTTNVGAAIELRDVNFTYQNAAGVSDFTLGPLDVTIHAGELVFVIGGNGSGKSTFVKLLTGLYTPQAGELRINGRLVDAGNRESYREHFAAVFSDFHLFEHLAGVGGHDVDDKAAVYLRLLGLDHKVRVENGVFSTIALSQGQRRRLALLGAYLEDRPVYVFDEWAADQDPAYRQIFYSKFLPELKARGKTVVVITHDDRYFHLGDRIIKLEYGKVVDTTDPATYASVGAPVGSVGGVTAESVGAPGDTGAHLH